MKFTFQCYRKDSKISGQQKYQDRVRLGAVWRMFGKIISFCRELARVWYVSFVIVVVVVVVSSSSFDISSDVAAGVEGGAR